MTFQEFAAKKVLGVPVLYLIGGAVIILVIVAVKMKPSNPDSQEPAPEDEALAEGVQGDPYDGFETKGTVTVVQQPPAQAENANASIETNGEWASKGAQFLVAKNHATGTVAISALQKYLNSQDRSFNEEELVNLVIKEYGPPPDGVDTSTGNVGTKPATKQFEPPGTHTIIGGADNSYSALAGLYYNSTAQDRIDLIEAANVKQHGKTGPWPAGTKITIPRYAPPRYYYMSKNPAKRETASQVAAKHSLGLDQLAALNNPSGGAYNPTYLFPTGATIRVG